jgi:hypothetical protein
MSKARLVITAVVIEKRIWQTSLKLKTTGNADDELGRLRLPRSETGNQVPSLS